MDEITRVGVDLAKRAIQVHAVDVTGRVIAAKQLQRESFTAWCAQLPPGWSAGDKTGTGDRGANNDLAIFWPPAGAPILVACYLTDSQQPAGVLNAAHAHIGAVVANALA